MNNLIVIFDFNAGNYSSIVNAIQYLGHTVKVSNDKSDIISAKAIILPGNGNLNYVINFFKKKNFMIF